MLRRALAVLGLAQVLSLAPPARAEPRCRAVAPWSRLPDSARHFAEPLPLALVAASALPPLALAPTGGDHRLRVIAQEKLGGRYRLEPVSVYAPYVLGAGTLVTYGIGALAGSCAVERPAAAVLQAMAAGLAATGLLKWSTGRGWPNAGRDPAASDRLDHPEYAHDFRPFRQGLGAFPSGHTLSMTVAAAAFRAAESDLGLVRFAGYPLVLGVGAGMWLGDRHWASDILSGALLGEAIGSSVGRAFHDPSPGETAPEALLLPVPGGALALVSGRF